MTAPSPREHEPYLARGYRYAGVSCGLRGDKTRPDIALVVSDRPASAAGVFTQNCVAAAPVQICRARLPSEDVRGFVVCAGNANACTGQRGLDDAVRMTSLAAERIGCRPDQMLVCSTGVIGQPLPMDRIEQGIRRTVADLGSDRDAFNRGAQAILTTDSRTKISTKSLPTGREDVRLNGFANGAAMI